MSTQTPVSEPIDRQRLYIQFVLAFGVLAGATFLAFTHIVTSDAVVALYGSAIGAVGAGAVGGYRARSALPPATNGTDTTGTETTNGGTS